MKTILLLLAVVVVIAAAFAVVIMSSGKALAVAHFPPGCDGRINHYVAQPDVAASNGKVTHSLKDIFGNSYDSAAPVCWDIGSRAMGRTVGYSVAGGLPPLATGKRSRLA